MGRSFFDRLTALPDRRAERDAPGVSGSPACALCRDRMRCTSLPGGVIVRRRRNAERGISLPPDAAPESGGYFRPADGFARPESRTMLRRIRECRVCALCRDSSDERPCPVGCYCPQAPECGTGYFVAAGRRAGERGYFHPADGFARPESGTTLRRARESGVCEPIGRCMRLASPPCFRLMRKDTPERLCGSPPG